MPAYPIGKHFLAEVVEVKNFSIMSDIRLGGRKFAEIFFLRQIRGIPGRQFRGRHFPPRLKRFDLAVNFLQVLPERRAFPRSRKRSGFPKPLGISDGGFVDKIPHYRGNGGVTPNEG